MTGPGFPYWYFPSGLCKPSRHAAGGYQRIVYEKLSYKGIVRVLCAYYKDTFLIQSVYPCMSVFWLLDFVG